MFRLIIIFFIALFSVSLADDEIIRAEIKYNELSAKKEAFKNIQRKLDKNSFKDYLKDPDYKENMELIKKNIFLVELKRELCPFYLRKTLASYSVTYVDKPYNAYYYNILGNLIKVDYIEQNSYPKKTLGYSRYGNLISVAFSVSEEEEFVYDEKGNLEAHWIGGEMINKNNKEPKILKLKRGEI